MTLKIFPEKTQEERTKTLADYLPNGEIFRAKTEDSTVLKRMLLGLAKEVARADTKMNEISCEQDIETTTLLIDEWESALGIPDGCFNGDGDLDERREHVLIKLSLAISTRESFIALAAEFGYTVEIIGGAYHGAFPMVFPIMFFPTGKHARFTMIVDLDEDLNPSLFTLTFPFTFGPRQSNIIECLFTKLRPANVELMFRYILADSINVINGTDNVVDGSNNVIF
jgi:uncharacterized protein YmfQ (DUF2313 family)